MQTCKLQYKGYTVVVDQKYKHDYYTFEVYYTDGSRHYPKNIIENRYASEEDATERFRNYVTELFTNTISPWESR